MTAPNYASAVTFRKVWLYFWSSPYKPYTRPSRDFTSGLNSLLCFVNHSLQMNWVIHSLLSSLIAKVKAQRGLSLVCLPWTEGAQIQWESWPQYTSCCVSIGKVTANAPHWIPLLTSLDAPWNQRHCCLTVAFSFNWKKFIDCGVNFSCTNTSSKVDCWGMTQWLRLQRSPEVWHSCPATT